MIIVIIGESRVQVGDNKGDKCAGGIGTEVTYIYSCLEGLVSCLFGL